MNSSAPEHPIVSILVVEDDLTVAELVRALFNDVPGWSATVAHDARGAREACLKVRFSALVLDVNLPGVSGLELLELLRAEPGWHAPPVILISAGEERRQIWAALRQGHATGFVAKPFELEQLLAAVKEVLASSSAGPAEEW